MNTGMNPSENSVAFGAPGIEQRWTSSAKEGLGTAYHTSCHLWFTLSHGIVNEIYYPHVDQPNTRDFQFLISGGDFLHLVRLGISAADDPIVLASIQVIDCVLRRDLPQGQCRRCYSHDGYGQKDDGNAFDGTGVDRSWPILTGERGHYELAAGRDPMSFIVAMEQFAHSGGMLTDQLWDADDLSDKNMKCGLPTGTAMQLCWSHAEYVSLVRSRHDGVCFDRVEPSFQRYVANPVKNRHEIWSFRHQFRGMHSGKILRIIIGAERRLPGQPMAGRTPAQRTWPKTARSICGSQIYQQRSCLATA